MQPVPAARTDDHAQTRKDAGPVNVASVPHLSPFRYAGGKTWPVPTVRRWVAGIDRRPATFVEPFAGGAIVSLSMVSEDLVGRAVLCEKDEDVGAVWSVLFNGSDQDVEYLCGRIASFEVTRPNCEEYLASDPVGTPDRAFRTILKNRVNHGGILAPGASLLKAGENNKGISSRWYPETLVRRLTTARAMKDRVDFVQGDAFDLIERHASDETCAFFVDPPYTAGGARAGARLYTHSQIDHGRLFEVCSKVAGEAMLTYDDTPEVETLASTHGMRVARVPMKTRQHSLKDELVILRGTSSV